MHLRGKRRWVSVAVAIALLSFSALASGATAALPPHFAAIPEDRVAGEGAGQLDTLQAVAADPQSGHLYVTEYGNSRVSEFTAWGEFVKAWGWGVIDGSLEMQVCTAATGCQAGSAGAGAGQFGHPLGGIAVDAAGAIYVGDMENHRVQKFSPAGDFLLMLGKEVNKTTKANTCTRADLENGDVCGTGLPGTGNSEFTTNKGRDYIEVSQVDDSLVVGDFDRVQRFNLDGTYKSQTALPLEAATGSLAIDPTTGGLYVSLKPKIFGEAAEFPQIYKQVGAGWSPFAEVGNAAAKPFPIQGVPESLATDSTGHVYVSATERQTGSQSWEQVLEFDLSGTCVICQSDDFARSEPTAGSNPYLFGIATGSGCEVANDALYVTRFRGSEAFVDAYGSTPDPTVCPPIPRPPTIGEQYAVAASSGAAILKAEINPHFWFDTTYYVQYGTEPCSSGSCNVEPVAPGASLGGRAVNGFVTTAGVALGGLSAGATYHFRFVSISGGGGPTFGEERTFRTYPAPLAPRTDCGNQGFRKGIAAFLPDCRAFEMVSPMDKEGGDVTVLPNIGDERAGLFQSSLDGARFTYSSSRAFGQPEGAPYSSQYIATRGSADWSTTPISPPREGETIPNGRRGLDSQFVAFSANLCRGWFFQDTEPVLAVGSPAGYTNLYRRDNCGSPAYSPMNDSAPPTTEPDEFWPELQGHSSDGHCAAFRANGKLTPDASSEVSGGQGIYQAYVSCDGELRLVSVLPNGSAANLESSVGTATGGKADNRSQSVWRAMSDDGSRIYWTSTGGSEAGAGTLYVRENATEEPSAVSAGECLEPEKACTYKASGAASNASFWLADPEGNKALFTVGGQLRQFDFTSKSSSAIAGEVSGLLGASDDLSRIYLVSEEDLGGEAEAGSPNLYLYEEGGTFVFIATLSQADALNGNTFPSPIAIQPIRHVSRVSHDGGSVAFMSTQSLTGYQNTDVVSGEPDAEVYLYQADGDKLVCVSCPLSGARPRGRELKTANGISYWAASQLPPWEAQLYPERALSEDGTRLVFESFDPLVLRDTNDKRDIYEWQSAATEAECAELGAELFEGDAGGCLSLISSGQSSRDSEFLDASLDGSSVFFATASSLLPQDHGLIDVYNARIDGGLPDPTPPSPPCEGGSCQHPSPPPAEPSISSSSFSGPGNVVPAKGRHRCRKPKVRRKGRCMTKKSKHPKAQWSDERGGSR